MSKTNIAALLMLAAFVMFIIFMAIREDDRVAACEKAGGHYLHKGQVCIKKEAVIEVKT